MFLTGASLFIVASLIIALAHEPTIIIIGHALQGLSASLITPMTLSIAKIAFSGSQEDLAVIFWTEIVG